MVFAARGVSGRWVLREGVDGADMYLRQCGWLLSCPVLATHEIPCRAGLREGEVGGPRARSPGGIGCILRVLQAGRVSVARGASVARACFMRPAAVAWKRPGRAEKRIRRRCLKDSTSARSRTVVARLVVGRVAAKTGLAATRGP